MHRQVWVLVGAGKGQHRAQESGFPPPTGRGAGAATTRGSAVAIAPQRRLPAAGLASQPRRSRWGKGAKCHFLSRATGLTHTPEARLQPLPFQGTGQGWGSGSLFQLKLNITFLNRGSYFVQPTSTPPLKTCFPQKKIKFPPLHQNIPNRGVFQWLQCTQSYPTTQIQSRGKWISTWKMFQVDGVNNRLSRTGLLI